MKKIFGAIGLGILAGISVAGYTIYKKNKKLNAELDKINENVSDFVENVRERLSKSAVEATTEKVNEMKEEIQESLNKLQEIKEEALQNINERHAAFDEEIKKMEENNKNLEIVAGNKEATESKNQPNEKKEKVKKDVKSSSTIETFTIDEEKHDQTKKTLEETEKVLDKLVEDINKM